MKPRTTKAQLEKSLFREKTRRKRLSSEVARLKAALAESSERAGATSAILRVISSSPTEVEPVFDIIGERAEKLCDAEISIVSRVDGDLIHLTSLHGVAEEGVETVRRAFPMQRSAETVTARAVRTCAVVHVQDVLDDRPYEQKEAARAGGYRGCLGVPMVREGQVIGVIFVARAKPGFFADTQVELLKTFADQAVIAIENVRLFKELEAKNHDLTEALDQQTATSEILRVISSSPTDIRPVLDALAQSAVRLCDSFDAIIFRVDAGALRLVAHHGPIPYGPIGEFTLPLGRGTVSGRSIIEHQTVQVTDLLTETEEFPEGAASARQFGYRTTLAVPLLRESAGIGAITLRRNEVRPFTERQVTLLQTFADQAVIAIENVRLFTELESRNRELRVALEQQTATSELLKVIGRSTFDLQPVFETLAENAVRLCEAERAFIFRFDGQLLRAVASYNVSPELIAFVERNPIVPGRTSATARAGFERRIVHVPDASADHEYTYASQQVDRFRTIIGIPMLRAGELLGVITIDRHEVRPFTDSQIALLETFADQAAIAIENVRLFKELEARTGELTRSVAELQALGDVSRAVSQTLDLDTVLATIASRAVQLSATDAGTIWEYDEAAEEFRLRAAPNLEDEIVAVLRGTPLRRGEGTVGRLADTRGAIQVADISGDPAYRGRLDVMVRSGYRAILSLPLLREDQLIGALTVNAKTPREFPPAVVDLLTTFAAQSALAIQNARLFREIEDKSRELEALSRNMEQLYRLSTAMQEPLSLKEQLGRVLETATRIGLLDRIYVWAVSPEGDKLVNLAGAGFAEDEWKQFEGFALPLVEAGAMYRSLREGRPLLFDDENPLPRDLYLKPQYLLKGLRTNRFLIIPMIARGETVGVFAGDNKPSGRAIARETVELLQTFASHGAVAIANARLFQTIEEKSRELEAASRHKSEFLSNMSHELRTPLNAIIGFSEVLGDRMFGELTDKQEEYLRDIMESGQHLLSLINDILDLSKIEAGRMELELTDFDLPQAIDNALTLVRERAGRREIVLHQAVDERLDEVRGDERKVKQVLLNLLSNALKFTPEGGRIDVYARLQDGSAEISVTDTGVGIAPEDQEAVFEEFRQVGTAAKKVEGTGLGLALSRKFVELHGGRIWVKSQVGMGSTFTFTLPVGRGE